MQARYMHLERDSPGVSRLRSCPSLRARDQSCKQVFQECQSGGMFSSVPDSDTVERTKVTAKPPQDMYDPVQSTPGRYSPQELWQKAACNRQAMTVSCCLYNIVLGKISVPLYIWEPQAFLIVVAAKGFDHQATTPPRFRNALSLAIGSTPAQDHKPLARIALPRLFN